MKNISASSLKRINVSDQIFEILKERINKGEWTVGEKLPSETELAAAFQVSRMSARAAIQRLSAVGLVDVRVGEGSFVKKYDPSDAFSEVAGKLYEPAMYDDLREFRLGFDKMVMLRACCKRTDDDLEAVRAIYAEMEAMAAANDLQGFNEADLRLHQGIIRMTGNSVFQMVGSMMHELLKLHYEESTQNYKKLVTSEEGNPNRYLQRLCEEHSYYIKALEERNPDLVLERLEPAFKQYELM